jgi:hypothetical protein
MLQAMLERYFDQLPQYLGLPLSQLKFKRVLFAGLPCYESGPLRPQFDRILQVSSSLRTTTFNATLKGLLNLPPKQSLLTWVFVACYPSRHHTQQCVFMPLAMILPRARRLSSGSENSQALLFLSIFSNERRLSTPTPRSAKLAS